MTYHILNGDSLRSRFATTEIEGELIICREGLIDGDVTGDTLPQFWQARAAYLEAAPETYHQMVVTEFEKAINAPSGSQCNLWFGYDLFCQVNMWFTVSLLTATAVEKELYVVYPTFLPPAQIWKDFGNATAENLKTSFKNRVRFGKDDLQLAGELWQAYKSGDLGRLNVLSYQPSACFPHLRAACKAHIDRFPPEGQTGRSEAVTAAIIKGGTTDFNAVFQVFFQREGVYGFGDTQFKKIYDRVMHAG